MLQQRELRGFGLRVRALPLRCMLRVFLLFLLFLMALVCPFVSGYFFSQYSPLIGAAVQWAILVNSEGRGEFEEERRATPRWPLL